MRSWDWKITPTLAMLERPPEPDLQESERYSVWHRLIKRFALVPGAAAKAHLSGIIQPVTVVDDLLQAPQVIQKTVALVGDANTTYLTVPEGDRFRLVAIQLSRLTGDRDIEAIRIVDPVSSDGIQIVVSLSGATFVSGILSSFPILDERWTMTALTDGGTTDGNWVCRTLVIREDAF